METQVKVKLEDIVIPLGRFRSEDNLDLKGLCKSFTSYGQLQPIVLEDETNVLVAGFRRYSAAKQIEWKEIEAVYKSQLTERKRREMELEENIQRKQMDFMEVEKAKVEIHKLRVAEDPNWTQNATARLLDQSIGNISQALLITKAAELFPEVAEAKSYKQALSIAKSKLQLQKRVREVAANTTDYGEIEQRILLGDCVELIKALPDGMFKIVLTDPPFGINYDDRKAGTEGAVTAYVDDKESYEYILTMAADIYRVLAKDGWLIWFLGPSWYERCKTVFRDVGFTVDEIPIIWDRSEGRTFTTRPDHYFARAYDIALHAFKGDPQIIKRNRPNIIRIMPVSTEDRELMVERPVELYEELLDRLTISGEAVLDPFLGSGSTQAALCWHRAES
jgi:site-specific DNA-methyltransferase (adenine-specific)